MNKQQKVNKVNLLRAKSDDPIHVDKPNMNIHLIINRPFFKLQYEDIIEKMDLK